MARIRAFAMTCAAATLGMAAASAPLSQTGIFVYSTLCAGPEDAGGAEVVLIREASYSSALFTRTEGPIMAPLLAYGPDVKIDERSGHVSLRFVDPAFGKNGIFTFDGTVSEDLLDIRTDGWLGHLVLPHIKALPGKLPGCRK